MHHAKWYGITISQLILLLLSACQQALLPEQVTEKFWLAVQAKDKEKIQQYSNVFWQTETDQLQIVPEFESFELGVITINKQIAEIETLLNTSNPSQPVTLTTHLVREDKIWRVDFEQSLSVFESSPPSEIAAELSELGELLSDEINQSIDELNKALPEIEQELSEFKEKIEAEIPGIQRKINELLKSLEELLSTPDKTAGQEEQTTEI